MKYKFNKNDFNSNDGMLTSVWGPSMWHSLHTISFNYPINPDNKTKKQYLNFFMSLQHILPCRYCRENFKKNIKSVPLNKTTMKNRYTLSKWLYNLHEEINRLLNKKSNLTYDDVRSRYELFRSRCLATKNSKSNIKNKSKTKAKTKKGRKVKELGCVKPLYGIKSKCIINIVPKNKKCKTFNIDKQCIIRQ
jgi:hypothetical protein